jgi:hypothetical protein
LTDLQAFLGQHNDEVKRCLEKGCFLAAIHLLVALPDVCASLQADHSADDFHRESSKRYRGWCKAYLPPNAKLGPQDLYQLRCALLHGWSTTPSSRRCRTSYECFSIIDPATFSPDYHTTTNNRGSVLNIHAEALFTDLQEALKAWTDQLPNFPDSMSHLQHNLPNLLRRQPKTIRASTRAGTASYRSGQTFSSS